MHRHCLSIPYGSWVICMCGHQHVGYFIKDTRYILGLRVLHYTGQKKNLGKIGNKSQVQNRWSVQCPAIGACQLGLWYKIRSVRCQGRVLGIFLWKVEPTSTHFLQKTDPFWRNIPVSLDMWVPRPGIRQRSCERTDGRKNRGTWLFVELLVAAKIGTALNTFRTWLTVPFP